MDSTSEDDLSDSSLMMSVIGATTSSKIGSRERKKLKKAEGFLPYLGGLLLGTVGLDTSLNVCGLLISQIGSVVRLLKPA